MRDHCRALKVTVLAHSLRSMQNCNMRCTDATLTIGRSSGFNNVISCELARRGVRPGVAEASDSGGVYGRRNAVGRSDFGPSSMQFIG